MQMLKLLYVFSVKYCLSHAAVVAQYVKNLFDY